MMRGYTTSTIKKVCVWFLIACVFTVRGGRTFDTTKITNLLHTAYDCHMLSNPALAVAVVKNGDILYSNGFGATNLEDPKPVTDETLFGIASVTKSFTATLFLKLLQEKTNLTVNSKVREFYGDEFQMPDQQRTNETTFLDLLSHKTAMLSNNRIRLDDKFNRKNIIKRLQLLPTPKQFRVDFVYSNLMYGLLARTSEIFAGDKEWENLISEHLFKPLNMVKSTFAPKIDFNREDLARGYSELDGPGILTPVSADVSRIWGGLCGSGSIISSVKDMANWLKFHLSGGKNGKLEQIVDKKLIEEQHTPRFFAKSRKYLSISKPEFPITVDNSAYAMGLRVGHYRGYRLISHSGSTFGYKAYMAMLPTEQIGVIVLMTGDDSGYKKRASLAQYLLDSALGVDPYLNTSNICSYPSPWVNVSSKTTYRPKKTDIPLHFKTEEYTGVFSNPAYGDIMIQQSSTSGPLQMIYGWGRWQMFVWTSKNNSKEQSFYLKGIEPSYAPDIKPVSFFAHPQNKDIIVGMQGTGFEKNLPPIFCKDTHKEMCKDAAECLVSKDKCLLKAINSASSLGEGKFQTIAILCMLFFLLNR